MAKGNQNVQEEAEVATTEASQEDVVRAICAEYNLPIPKTLTCYKQVFFNKRAGKADSMWHYAVDTHPDKRGVIPTMVRGKDQQWEMQRQLTEAIAYAACNPDQALKAARKMRHEYVLWCAKGNGTAMRLPEGEFASLD